MFSDSFTLIYATYFSVCVCCGDCSWASHFFTVGAATQAGVGWILRVVFSV